jgi:hypothetical protein
MASNTRIRLPAKLQKELVEKAKAKTGLSWSEFARLLNLNAHYLSHELRNGECTLPLQVFKRLRAIYEQDYGNDVEVIASNWGQRKGGLKGGGGKPKRVEMLAGRSDDLAEIIGVILGDGHLEKSHRTGHYAVKICGGEDDLTYLASFVAPLFLRVFGKQLKSFRFKKAKGVMFYVHDKSVVFTLEHHGLKPGNKKDNDVCVPAWIFENEGYLKACLRGIFDTDGTVFPKSANPKIPQLELTSKVEGIQRTYRQGLLQLGFTPSKWSKTDSPKCGLYAINQVLKFAREIGFRNPKHGRRFEDILSKK